MPFDPEIIWQQSQLDFNTTAGFLHENCMHFLEDGAIEDAALETEFFSDSGLIPLLLQNATFPRASTIFIGHPNWKRVIERSYLGISCSC